MLPIDGFFSDPVTKLLYAITRDGKYHALTRSAWEYYQERAFQEPVFYWFAQSGHLLVQG